MAMGLGGWNELGIAGTIYEEEEEDDQSSMASSIPSPESPHILSSTAPIMSDAINPPWNRRRRRIDEPDALIHVQDSCFPLHKEILARRSGYLKRQLSMFNEITLSPPLNISAETFSLVADFCYRTEIAITPFNVVALRTAAELLDMTASSCDPEENLQQKTEAYFCRAVAASKEYASIVLQSCVSLLPEAETSAALASRCIEALSLMSEEGGWLGDVKRFGAEDLELILESLSQRLTESHDLLYKIIDFYITENGRMMREEQKIGMCNYIDCGILSHRILMHAVQNPRMPLRFVVQAMFVEQLNTRRSIFSAADHKNHHQTKDPITLGAILQRDAALRQVAQLKNVMTATNSRIQTLERELSGMRKLLGEMENDGSRIGSARSASFRFSSETGNRMGRGQIGSASDLSVRRVGNTIGAACGSSSSEESRDGAWASDKKFGRRLFRGLKNALGLQSSVSKRSVKGSMKSEEGEEGFVVIRKDQVFHRRSRSQS